MSVASDRDPRGAHRPLRADAARNHRAIVAAARAALEQDGPDVPLEEVARRAGVGPSTLYRRFAGREELLAAVFEDYFAERIEPLLAAAGADDDPWHALVAVLEGMVDAVLRHRPLLHAVRRSGAVSPDIAERALGPLADLVARGQEAGVLRADVVAKDLPTVVLMTVVTAGPWDGANDPRAWPRYLALLLDGLRPTARRLPDRAEPPAPPPRSPTW
jgi:AcrR family transcriptional regulator